MVDSLPSPSSLASHWTLDPDVVFLNHGSFGACPRVVLEAQAEWRSQMERRPVEFLHRMLEPRLDEARAKLAEVVGADAQDVAFVQNATSGVNSVLRSLELERGAHILVTDQEYQASWNALDYVAERTGAEVEVVSLPFPIEGPDLVIDRIMARVRDNTRLVLIDHIVSPTALILPIPELVRRLRERGVETLVDGAHGPGHIPLELEAWGVAYYTGNCHKWLCTPKGSALLYVRRDLQESVRPITISHGATLSKSRSDRSRFLIEFDWMGTHDPTPFLVLPTAIDFLSGLFEGGLSGLMQHNHALARKARDTVCRALGIEHPAPDSMVGTMASFPLPPLQQETAGPLFEDPLHVALREEAAIEIPVMGFGTPRQRVIRLSAQAYNAPEQYDYLATEMVRLLA